MITLILGLQGSAKTSSMVREMMNDTSGRMYFSNIITKGIKNNVIIKPDMIMIKQPILDDKGNQKTRKGEKLYTYKVNKDFWIEASKKYKGLNIIIDEAHAILNSRRGMNIKSQVILDWISLLRRVIGSTQSGYGRLFLVTQIERRLDIVAKEQSTQCRYYLCHYQKTCTCGFNMNENNETPETIETCPYCNKILKKCHHHVEVWHFQDYSSFINWKYLGKGKTYYRHYIITDIEKVFSYYNTLQWDNYIIDI